MARDSASRSAFVSKGVLHSRRAEQDHEDVRGERREEQWQQHQPEPSTARTQETHEQASWSKSAGKRRHSGADADRARRVRGADDGGGSSLSHGGGSITNTMPVRKGGAPVAPIHESSMAELRTDNEELVNAPRDDEQDAASGGEEEGAGPRRSKRTVTRVDYSEVRRRGAQQAATKKRKARDAPVAYMDGAGAKRGRLTLAKAIEVGTAAIDRVVGERYEWRDGAYAERRVVVFDDGG